MHRIHIYNIKSTKGKKKKLFQNFIITFQDAELKYKKRSFFLRVYNAAQTSRYCIDS